MKFISTHEIYEETGMPIYEEFDYEADEISSIKRFLRLEVTPPDMDESFEEEIEFRFENGRAFYVYFEANIIYDPEWDIETHHEIKEIPEEQCSIKELPGEYKKIKIPFNLLDSPEVDEDDTIIGIVLTRDKKFPNGHTFPQATSTLALREINGEWGFNTYASVLHETIFVPLSTLAKNNFTAELVVKHKNKEPGEELSL